MLLSQETTTKKMKSFLKKCGGEVTLLVGPLCLSLMKNLENLAENIDPIFITVDPKRDKPELLKQYLSFFDKRIIGLTGSQEQIENITNQYHVYYSYQKKDEVDNYTVNHTANMYFLDKNNNVEKIFIPGTPFEELFKYVNKYLIKM